MSGGTGSRMNTDIPKQLLKFGKKNLLEMSIRKFQDHPDIDTIFIVSHPDLINITEEIVDRNKFSKVSKVIPGGSTRQISSRNGVFAADKDHYKILVHDSARPFVPSEVITRVLSALDIAYAVTPVINSSDTLVHTDHEGHLSKYLNRDNIKRVQTPQGFKLDTILKAHKKAEEDSLTEFTDDCSMILHFSLSDVVLVEGDKENTKITYREDIDRLNLKE